MRSTTELRWQMGTVMQLTVRGRSSCIPRTTPDTPLAPPI